MRHDSPRTRALPRPGLLRQTALLAVTLAALSRWAPPPAGTATTIASSPTATTTVAVSVHGQGVGQGVLLADEITRRLRRMGINFSRTRLPHPYDPVGEIC